MGSNAPASRQRLDSWKEIAAFFDRDERTLSRWEKELGLPVHRLPGAKGRVYAYTDELSAWLAEHRNARGASRETAVSPVDAEAQSRRLEIVAGQRAATAAAEGTPERLADRHASRWDFAWKLGAPLIAGALVFALVHYWSPNISLDTKRHTPAARAGSSGGVVQASSPTHNLEAEQLYLKGKYFWNTRTPDGLNKALDYFTQAIVRDPNYALAYVGLADCYNLLREYTLMPASEAYPRALAAARKAVELDDQSSEAHASLAFALFFGSWDVGTADREFRRAIDLNPENALAHHWYANYLMTLRRLPESLAEMERAQALDPASKSILADKGNILFLAGRKDEAVQLLKQIEISDPAFRSPHVYLKSFYLQQGDYANFLAESKKDALLVHDNSALAMTSAAERGFATGGAQAMFESMLNVQKKFYDQGLVSPVVVAQTCALLGKNGEALQYLKIALSRHDELLLPIQNYPALNSLHDDPGYRELLSRIGLPNEN